MKATGVAFALVAMCFAAGCSGTTHSSAQTNGHAIPLPPERACVFPDANAINDLATASTVVVEATVQPGRQSPGPSSAQVVWQFSLTAVRVVSDRGGPAPMPSSVTEMGVSDDPMLRAGRYLLFLTSAGQSFFVTNGLAGAFPIASAKVGRECPNYADPANRLHASGNAPDVATIEGEVPSPLPERPSTTK